MEGEKKSRARFAQHAIRPEEVAPEWKRWKELLGDAKEVGRFTSRAMSRLNAPLEGTNGGFKAHLAHLPLAVKERLAARNLEETIRIAFEEPAPLRFSHVTRSHPLPSILAETLLEGALDPASGNALGRAGAWPTPAVKVMTTVALLRLRFKLTVHGRRERLLLVEEANGLAFAADGSTVLTGESARALLEEQASGNLVDVARARLLTQARERIATVQSTTIASFAKSRAEALAQDHERVRTAGIAISKVKVEPVLPADVIGLFVLVPAGV
jgi:hypothetical protein